MLKKLIIAAGAALLSTSAQAVLVVDIVSNGAGSSIWTFSGSATAGGSGAFQDGNNINDNFSWQDLSQNFTLAEDFEIFDVVGDPMLTIGSETRAIDLVLIDNDFNNATAFDDFAVGVEGPGDFTFADGDTVSWTGSAVVGVGVELLGESGLPITLTTSTFGSSGTLDLQVNVAAVPLPTALPMMVLGMVGLGWVTRRKRG